MSKQVIFLKDNVVPKGFREIPSKFDTEEIINAQMRIHQDIADHLYIEAEALLKKAELENGMEYSVEKRERMQKAAFEITKERLGILFIKMIRV